MVPLIMIIFYAPGLKGPTGASSNRLSVCSFVRLGGDTVINNNKLGL